MWARTIDFLKDHLSPDAVEKYGPLPEAAAATQPIEVIGQEEGAKATSNGRTVKIGETVETGETCEGGETVETGEMVENGETVEGGEAIERGDEQLEEGKANGTMSTNS